MKDFKQYRLPEHGLQMEETVQAGDRIGAEHLFRYWWAWDVARQVPTVENIMDAGCGAGYGCQIMLEIPTAKNIIGIDSLRGALDVARGDYADTKLLFKLHDLDQDWLGLNINRLNMITAFEIFELLKHRDMFLEQCTRWLEPDGMLLLSVHLKPTVMPHPADAYIHYDSYTLLRQLHRYFEVVKFNDGDPVFRLVDFYNKYIKDQGKTYEVGQDLVLCSKPRP